MTLTPPLEFAGRRVTVMGLGEFGGNLAAIRFLADRGAQVTVTDLKSPDQLAASLATIADLPAIKLVLGRHDPVDFSTAELVVASPAVRRDHPLLVLAREQGITVTSEMNLCWARNRGRVAAVTGSNGKSTTTALLAHLLRATGARVWLGGNIGRSLLPHLDQIGSDDWTVLELSSFQLADLDELQARPDIAVVTNFSPNHLDWHRDLDDYRWAKQTLLRWQQTSDVAVLNVDDGDVWSWPTRAARWGFGTRATENGVHSHEGRTAALSRVGQPTQPRWIERDWLSLPGRHNWNNALAAAAAATAVGITPQQLQTGLESFRGLPHRLEHVGEFAGRQFYNDSLATTPESAVCAIEAFERPIVLLAGGYDKRVSLAGMAAAIAQRVKAVALLGQTGEMLAQEVQQHHGSTEVSPVMTHFAFAFEWALAHSQPGDIVLLSPGCASYDMFRNFADRGEQFRQLFLELKSLRARAE